MNEQLDKIKAINHYAYPFTQWQDDDFKPIMNAIDGLFATLGWLYND